MAWFRLSELVWVLAAVSGMALLNGHMRGVGSDDLQRAHWPSAFGPARGWPFACVARFSEEDHQSQGWSRLPKHTVYIRNLFHSGLPHLAVDGLRFALNVLVATLVAIIPVFLMRHRRASRRSFPA
jgi:hypothetical protein